MRNDTTDVPELGTRGQRLDAPDRLAALRATGLLDSPTSERYDRLTRMASSLLNAPTALMSLVDDHRQFFSSFIGLPEPWATARETPLSHSFCQHVVTSGAPLRIENAPEHPLVRDNLAIPELGVISYLGVPIVSDSGHNLGSFCVIDTVPRKWTDSEEATLQDISLSLQTELNLKAALVEAESQMQAALDANRTKSDFLARMSHELRTPLNSVIGFANVLLRNKASNLREQDMTYLSRIQKNGVHLLGLINDLLDLAKIESGKLDVHIATVDLRELISDVDSLMDVQASLKGVALETVIPARAQTLIQTDRLKLHQILVNLVGNALKFTSRGTIKIELSIDGNNNPRAISVTDCGIGIPAHRVDAIFNAFEQAERSTAERFGGTGLGLPISRSLAGLMGYELTVSSVEGEGSTFTLRLKS